MANAKTPTPRAAAPVTEPAAPAPDVSRAQYAIDDALRAFIDALGVAEHNVRSVEVIPKVIRVRGNDNSMRTFTLQEPLRRTPVVAE